MLQAEVEAFRVKRWDKILTRSDVISLGVAVAIAGLGWFIRGRTVALICGGVGLVLILIAHVLSRKSITATTLPSFSGTFHPKIEQINGDVGTVKTGDVKVNVVFPHTLASAATPSPALQAPNPKLEILTPPDVWPIGWNGRAWMEYPNLPNSPAVQTGIFLTVINKPAEEGMDGALAEDLTATLEFSENGKRLGIISTACWRCHEQNRIDLQPGENCPLFLGHIDLDGGALIGYENTRKYGRIPPRSATLRVRFNNTPLAPPEAKVLAFQSVITVDITVVSQSTRKTLLKQRLKFRRTEKTIEFVRD